MTENWKALRRTCAALFLLSVAPASGDIIVGMQASSASPNSTGNFFDVYLLNSGPSSASIDSFTFGIQTTNLNISFTGATFDTTVAAYIFAGNSLFGPDLSGPTSGQTLNASDIAALNPVVVSSGSTVGLGHVFYDVAAGTPTGTFDVTLIPASTSLSDVTGSSIAVDTLNAGSITILTPEPSSLGLLAFILICGALYRARTRRLPATF